MKCLSLNTGLIWQLYIKSYKFTHRLWSSNDFTRRPETCKIQYCIVTVGDVILSSKNYSQQYETYLVWSYKLIYKKDTFPTVESIPCKLLSPHVYCFQSLEELQRFSMTSLSWWGGSIKDVWFFLKYHYRKFFTSVNQKVNTVENTHYSYIIQDIPSMWKMEILYFRGIKKIIWFSKVYWQNYISISCYLLTIHLSRHPLL